MQNKPSTLEEAVGIFASFAQQIPETALEFAKRLHDCANSIDPEGSDEQWAQVAMTFQKQGDNVMVNVTANGHTAMSNAPEDAEQREIN